MKATADELDQKIKLAQKVFREKANMSEPKIPDNCPWLSIFLLTPNGFSGKLTVPGTSGRDLLNKIKVLEPVLTERGFKPDIRGKGYNTRKTIEYVEGLNCPECGGRLIKKAKKDGTPFHQCENRKYDWQTKQTSGCPFIDWLGK